VFDQAYSVAPYTQASFPGILTSSYLFDTLKAEKLSAKRTLISEALKSKGVTTAAFHSNAYLSGYFGWNRGWDAFYDSMEEDVDLLNPYIKGNVINRKVDQWLGTVDLGRSLFLWVHYMDVHEPYVPDRRFVERVDGSIRLSAQEMFGLFKSTILPRNAGDKATVALLRSLYEAHVCEADEYARELFGILDRHGVLRDATVIFTTDHGEEFGEHGGLSHDGKMYDELVHVPQIVVNPPEGKGGRCATLVSGLDIPPTVLHLFGLESEPNFQGHSFFPLNHYSAKGVYGEAVGKLAHKIKETDQPAYYYREGALKVIYRKEEDGWELYDLASDSEEKNNIMSTSPEAGRMKQKLEPRINRVYL
jgi:arylsulfatase A-like enzyme